ncbi:MAG: DUF367 domain-containing protein [Thermoplasmata archaeon]|nr:DUF367 domain-containing protein [Thermoplasmata archaeon]
MRSSGSTPSPTTSPSIPVLLWVAGEDHPRACTGRRLLERKVVRPLPARRPPRELPVLLDPRSDIPLSRNDREACERGGFAGVDCSWNRLGARGGYPEGPEWLGRLRERRRLPFLLAGNPQHYGRLAELNTAEAIAAALYVLGDAAGARSLLEEFAGSEGFWALNANLLESYANALDAKGVRAAEATFF